jgi:hypothetical protein
VLSILPNYHYPHLGIELELMWFSQQWNLLEVGPAQSSL